MAIAPLLWGLGTAGLTEGSAAGTAVITAVVVMIAIELVTTGVERFFVLRHRHPDPGSVPMTVIVAVLPLPISYLIGLLTGQTFAAALVTMAVTAVVYWTALITLDRPWLEGASRADIRRQYEQTKTMTRERFRTE